MTTAWMQEVGQRKERLPRVALARTMRAIRAPSIAARLRRNRPKDGPHDVGQFDARPRMDCRRTP